MVSPVDEDALCVRATCSIYPEAFLTHKCRKMIGIINMALQLHETQGFTLVVTNNTRRATRRLSFVTGAVGVCSGRNKGN